MFGKSCLSLVWPEHPAWSIDTACMLVMQHTCLRHIHLVQICEAFGANRYPFPEEPARQRQMNAEVTARLRELHTTIEAGQCQVATYFGGHHMCTTSFECQQSCLHMLMGRVLFVSSWCQNASGVKVESMQSKSNMYVHVYLLCTSTSQQLAPLNVRQNKFQDADPVTAKDRQTSIVTQIKSVYDCFAWP